VPRLGIVETSFLQVARDGRGRILTCNRDGRYHISLESRDGRD
jgi:hypothetical protein